MDGRTLQEKILDGTDLTDLLAKLGRLPTVVDPPFLESVHDGGVAIAVRSELSRHYHEENH
jgi:hypothetical protein